MRLDLADWNNDGVMDLILGNLNGTVNYYEGYCFRVRSPGARGSGQVTLEWDSAASLSYDVMSGPTPNGITDLVATNLPSSGNNTQWTNSTTPGDRFFRVRIAR